MLLDWGLVVEVQILVSSIGDTTITTDHEGINLRNEQKLVINSSTSKAIQFLLDENDVLSGMARRSSTELRRK